MAHAAGWPYKPGQAGWGSYEVMLDTLERAIGGGPWLLGERFTMADVVFGASVRFMLRFKMLEARPAFVAYSERLSARPGGRAEGGVGDHRSTTNSDVSK